MGVSRLTLDMPWLDLRRGNLLQTMRPERARDIAETLLTTNAIQKNMTMLKRFRRLRLGDIIVKHIHDGDLDLAFSSTSELLPRQNGWTDSPLRSKHLESLLMSISHGSSWSAASSATSAWGTRSCHQ